MKTERNAWGDLLIAGLVVAVVAVMIVPLPRFAVDLLLTLNLGVALVLLLVSVFVTEPLRIAAFPTLLLLTTLLRVGVNVATTRLILARGDAGDVVAAFGSMVVAGNIVVGLVIFALITIVQYLVVARGAERVAEVSARFALDAMPGKQLAIDADLRAGLIDAGEAQRRRDRLGREGSFYGAMDGAMKFVKGDAIAAIVIVAINLAGGLAIGIGYHHLPLGQAVATYSLLSVGEGLVAQIPALLLAVAAGLLVTRVAGDGAIGNTITSQVLEQPRALALSGGVLGGLALVPGLPFVPFFVAAVAAGVGAFAIVRRRVDAPRVLATVGTSGRTIRIEVDGRVDNPETRRRAATILDEIRGRFDGRGLPLTLEVVVVDASDPHTARVVVDGVAVAWLSAANLPLELERELGPLLERSAADLVDLDAVQAMLDRTAVTSPVVVREVVPRLVSLPTLTEVVRHLYRERIPLGDFATVLAAIAAAPPPDSGSWSLASADALAERVRATLRRQITAHWAPRHQLAAFTVDDEIEDAVRSAIEPLAGSHHLTLEPELARDIVASAKKALPAGNAVVLTASDIRRHLRQLLAVELPDVTVLSPHELAPGVVIVTEGRITIGK